jgi:TIR domain-containing protein
MAEMTGVRVFVSFDVDHDADLGDRLAEQSRRAGSGFHVASRSQAGAMSDLWEASVRQEVRDADEVIVICSEHTAASPRMSAELRIAQEEQRPYLLLWGRRERMCAMPLGLKQTARMYSWTWDTLVYQVAQTLRDDAHSRAADHVG